MIGPDTRGMGFVFFFLLICFTYSNISFLPLVLEYSLGKKLFEHAVTELETAHPECLAMFVETHGISVEDGVHSSFARQKYFSDLGFNQVNVPYMTTILYGKEDPCYDFVLVVRPMRAAGVPKNTPVAVHMPLVRSFLIAYWEFTSSWMYEGSVEEESPHVQWLCSRGYGYVDYDGVSPGFVVVGEDARAPATVDEELLLDDCCVGEDASTYSPLLSMPWDFKYYDEVQALFARKTE